MEIRKYVRYSGLAIYFPGAPDSRDHSSEARELSEELLPEDASTN